MADTTFVDGDLALSNRIVAAWLNDVNKLRYGANDATRGAELLQFLAGGTGSATRTAQAKMRERLSVIDKGAKGNGVYPSGGDDDSDAIIAALADCADGRRNVYFPFGETGIYNVTKPLTWPDNVGIIFEKGVQIFYYDTATPESNLLSNGVADTRGGGCYAENLSIVLRTATACGIDLLNSIDSLFCGMTYIEGYIAPNWATDPITINNLQNNRGIRIGSSASTDCFGNYFENLVINSAKTGVQMPETGIATYQVFANYRYYGNAALGFQNSYAFVWRNCSYSEIRTAFIEGCYNTTGGGIIFAGANAAYVRATGSIVFNHSNDTLHLYGPGNPIPMDSIRCKILDAAYPSGIGFPDGTVHDPYCSIVNDAPAAKGNFFGYAVDYPGVPFTTTLTCGVSGTITLTSGLGGDVLLTETHGQRVRVWGFITIASVSSPLGPLYVALPRTVLNNDANYRAAAIRTTGLDSVIAAGCSVQGYTNRNSTLMEIELFKDGDVVRTAGTSLAASAVKAATTFMFDFEYIASQL